MKEMSFVEAMKDYFGFLPGQNMTQFFAELKVLTPVERDWFKQNLVTVGYKIISKV
jgi:hypothetical protein